MPTFSTRLGSFDQLTFKQQQVTKARPTMVSLLLVTFVAFIGVAAARTTKGDQYYRTRCEDILGDGSNGVRALISGNDLPSCPGPTEQSWYNFNVKIELPKDSECDEQDRFVIGALVSEIVREIECSIPEYKEEVFYGEM